jgi:hypothetical protein
MPTPGPKNEQNGQKSERGGGTHSAGKTVGDSGLKAFVCPEEEDNKRGGGSSGAILRRFDIARDIKKSGPGLNPARRRYRSRRTPNTRRPALAPA